MKEYRLTKEDMAVLKKYEAVFNTVVHQNYKRGTTDADNRFIADFFDKVTGEKHSRNFGCSSCLFNIWKGVGTIYYNNAQRLMKEDLENEKVNSIEGPDGRGGGKAKKTGSKKDKAQ